MGVGPCRAHRVSPKTHGCRGPVEVMTLLIRHTSNLDPASLRNEETAATRLQANPLAEESIDILDKVAVAIAIWAKSGIPAFWIRRFCHRELDAIVGFRHKRPFHR